MEIKIGDKNITEITDEQLEIMTEQLMSAAKRDNKNTQLAFELCGEMIRRLKLKIN